MKKLTARQWAHALYTLLTEAKEIEWPEIIDRVMKEIKRRRATRLVPRIIRQFADVVDEATGTVRIHTRATHELSKSAERELATIAPSVVIDHTIDRTLVGGLVVHVGDMIVDASVATRLQKIL